MSTPYSQSLRPNRCVVSEYEVSNFLGSQEWDIFQGHPVVVGEPRKRLCFFNHKLCYVMTLLCDRLLYLVIDTY